MSRELFVTVDVAAGRDAAYEAIATLDGLRAFWTPSVSGDPDVGGTLSFGFEPAPVDLEMAVDELAPGESVSWRCLGPWPGWEGTTVRWRLAEAPEGGTRVVLGHTGWDDDTPDEDLGAVTFTWGLVAGALKGYLETGEAQPALR